MKRQTPHYEPNQITLWLYIISADCWWGALIIRSPISPRMVGIINSDCQPLDLTDHLLVYCTGHCWQAVAFVFVLLKEEKEVDALKKIHRNMKVTFRQGVTHHSETFRHCLNLCAFTWEPWLFVLYNQLSIYSVFHHWAVTWDVVVIYCRWQLTAEHKVQQWVSLCCLWLHRLKVVVLISLFRSLSCRYDGE